MQLSLEQVILYSIITLTFILAFVTLIMVVRLRSHYNNLTQGVEPKNLIKALEGIQKTLSEHERTSSIIRKETSSLKQDVQNSLQTLSLKRFNPFSDTGGDQSFILGILDGHKNGVVITSLHSRENTRFYVKSVEGGVGIDHPLSAEEQKIIKR